MTILVVLKFEQPTRQKLNYHYDTSRKRYSNTFRLFSLSEGSDYTQQEMHNYFMSQSKKNFSFGHFSTSFG